MTVVDACYSGSIFRAIDPASRGWLGNRCYATASMLRVLAESPAATYRQLYAAVDERAREFLTTHRDVGTPTLYHSATHESLLDSPAFAPLDW